MTEKYWNDLATRETKTVKHLEAEGRMGGCQGLESGGNGKVLVKGYEVSGNLMFKNKLNARLNGVSENFSSEKYQYKKLKSIQKV